VSNDKPKHWITFLGEALVGTDIYRKMKHIS